MAQVRQPSHERHDIREPEDAGHARRALRRLAEGTGVSGEVIQRAELAVTELATNLLRHAGSGTLLLRVLPEDSRGGVEIVSLDQGPGISSIVGVLADPDRARLEQRIGEGKLFESLGVGLASVKRAASEFDIWSRAGEGTAIVARVCADPGPRHRFRVAGVSVPLAGEHANGDGWAARCTQDRVTLVMVDGLGHGPEAAKAAQAALDAFAPAAGDDLLGYVARAHAAMRSTRGGALAIARLDSAARTLEFCGVGNVTARLLGKDGRRLVTRVGTLGLAPAVPRVQVDRYECPVGATLLMHTDGVREHFGDDRYEPLLRAHPALLAALIWRDQQRGRDDATLAVIQDLGT